jgi:hypothetical protein
MDVVADADDSAAAGTGVGAETGVGTGALPCAA